MWLQGGRGKYQNEFCINVIGNHTPQILIFPRLHFKDQVLLQLQLQVKNQQVGKMRVFWPLEALYHVQTPCKEDPALVNLDTYESNLSILAISVAKENWIIMLTLPPYTSHSYRHLIALCLAHTKHIVMFTLMTGYRQECTHLQCCRHYWKIFQQGTYQTKQWDWF